MVCRNFENISKTEDFLNITADNLKLFVSDDETRGVELDIFIGCIR
jgi:hypothetical protein